MPQLEVSTARSDDLDELVPLFDDYRQFYRKLPNPELAHNFLSERFKNRDSVIFIARLGHELVGFAQMFHSLSSVTADHVWQLNDLYVVLAARRSGAGRALVEKAKTYAARTGAKYLRVVVQKDNLALQNLYTGQDFKLDHDHLLFHCKVDT